MRLRPGWRLIHRARRMADTLLESAVKAGLLDEAEPGLSLPDGAGLPQPAGEDEITAVVEALILAAGDGISAARIAEITRLSLSEIEAAAARIALRCAADASGIELTAAAGGYQFRTKPRFGDYCRALFADRPRRLTPAALETLAVIAYRQPVVKSDIEKIRGVDATPTLKTLLERGLIRIVGHGAGVGRPALYGTTDLFLKIFGLNSLAELPTLRDLKEFDGVPGEGGGEPDEAGSESADSGSVDNPRLNAA